MASADEPRPVLRFHDDGAFKIVQFTDIHWGEDAEPCRKSLDVLNRVLDDEKPDLVVLTGDIVTLPRSPLEGWDRVVEPIVARKIPWAAVLGNHDDERHGVGRRAIVEYLAKQPYSVTQTGPDALDGSGNYVLDVVGHEGRSAATLYLLDSHAYPTIPAIREHKEVSQYGWLSFDQIAWYRETSRERREAAGDRPLPALAFFHIPLVEYDSPVLAKNQIGTRNERVCCGALNSGMFTALVEEGDVLGVFVGHDHDNDYAGALFGVCLAYGRCSGFGSYGDLPRGGRVIELKEGRREFDSWVRPLDGEIVDRFHFEPSEGISTP